MSAETRFDTTEHGEARLTITLTGSYDYLRFAVNMLDDQVEFCRAGREALAELRDYVGPKRFDPWARSLLGDERYEKLSGYGFFEHASEDL